MTLRKHEITALKFIAAKGRDQIGTVDTDGKFAAALCYHHLRENGFLVAVLPDEGGPVYYLTKAGRQALERLKN